MAQTNTVVLGVLLGLVLLVNVVGFALMASNSQESLSSDEVQSIVSSELAKVPAQSAPVVNTSELDAKIAVLDSSIAGLKDLDEFVETEKEDLALKLALAELDTKDFKKAVFNALVLKGEDIEDYKDITLVTITDSDVDVDNEEAEVTISIKVVYFVDGDADEVEKAKLDDVVITVTDLDEDDDYVDAEVDESYLDSIVVSKVYD